MMNLKPIIVYKNKAYLLKDINEVITNLGN